MQGPGERSWNDAYTWSSGKNELSHLNIQRGSVSNLFMSGFSQFPTKQERHFYEFTSHPNKKISDIMKKSNTYDIFRTCVHAYDKYSTNTTDEAYSNGNERCHKVKTIFKYQ